jgi:LmbE family N-acetylglucosaminyl deacetylase
MIWGSNMANKKTLVAVFAHPDDEAFGTGGTLARYAREGVDVHLVMATGGEAGQIANPEVETTMPISVLREQELRCACEQYGLKELHLMGYLDGQTTMVPPSEPVFRLVKILRRLKPQVVISFGPDGIYGHFDHVAIHRWTAAAVALAGDNEKWPAAGSPHRVNKFYYRAMSLEQIEQMKTVSGRSTVDMGGVPFAFTGYPSEQITTVVDVKPYVHIKLKAILCHRSQVNPDFGLNQKEFNPEEDDWFRKETFILAGTEGVAERNGVETDLFQGITE